MTQSAWDAMWSKPFDFSREPTSGHDRPHHQELPVPRKMTVLRDSDQTYGRIEAFLHVAGYTMARAFNDVEELLDSRNRWREFGHADINEFLASFNFKELEANIKTKIRLAKRIQELQPAVSNRLAARTVGVDEGTLRADKSAKAKQKSKEKQRRGADQSAGRLSSGADVVRLEQKVQERQERNENRQAAALARTTAVEFNAQAIGKHAVLYADPPWRYENPPMGAGGRSVENHYPTMTLEEICALPVGDIANDDSVLFLWATNPKLYECMKVLDAWGFQYRTDMVWIKDRIGMGYYAREQHETLLIARRGELPPPSEDARPSSVIRAPRLEHSAKPLGVYDMIDTMYPKLRKIELFGRGVLNRSLWSSWGNQVMAEVAIG